ncbi:hypothetical protein [Actinoalloteichus hymeniacidonis]|uniref:ABC-2 family transporter protein n=1 Tax=Actinoalloteichus hymeniacidonis TaxID=340345 RepID=A0AAC9HQE0_9PSEU|nr:hypothetical protein [Actinoalloteichus hymeniacidonis]AOS63066.1 hypothetical protein TL08_11260 [Actinoalloteichus hymeniacidonis]MBB5908898.1 hypothetical protein [Actinoalloteichus hymeniacidonis]
MKTIAAARYLLADLLRSQLFLAPMLTYAAVLAILFSNDAGAPPEPWAASVLLLYPISAWLATTVANSEEPVGRTVTVVAAGGHGPILAGTVVVCVLGDLLLIVTAVGVPVIGTGSAPPALIGLGLLAHLGTALAGTAVGLLCARPLVHRAGWTFAATSGVVLATALTPWLPPVGTTVRRLGTPDVDLWGGTLLDLGIGAGALAAVLAVVLAVLTRRA